MTKPNVSALLSKAKEVDYSKFFLQTVVGLFLVTLIGQVVGGYIVNRIEEHRQDKKKRTV
jgi:hypothetical protein